MSIAVGNPVTLKTSSVSTAGGVKVALKAGRKGRVCRITDFGFCSVQFHGIGCRRVHKKRLQLASEPAPKCTAACS